jgi:hypothetical protein
VPGARRLLRRLVDQRLIAEPVLVDGKRGYQLKGPGSYAEILPAALRATNVVTPAGFARFRITAPLAAVYRRVA